MQIIFIPGLLCTNLVWGQLNRLRVKYVCHDADVTTLSSISEMADLIVNNMPSEDVAIIGISMGGYVAIDIATKAITNIKKLVLINTTAKPVNTLMLSEREKAIKLAEQGKINDVLEMSKNICYSNPKDEWFLLEKKMANEIGAHAYINQQRAIMNRKDYSNSIKSIIADTLIISGKDDKVIPYKDSFDMFEQISSASLVILNECGHLSTIEKNEVIADYIFDFLES